MAVSPAGDVHPPTDQPSQPLGRRRLGLPEEVGVVAALVVLIVVIGLARPRFLNPLNLLTILGNTTFEGMLSLGMVFLLAIREIDLSVGWMFNFSAVVSALLMAAGVNPWIATVGGVCFGALLGLMNGILATGLRLPTIIITLGTYSMFQGLSLVVNQGRAVVPSDYSSSFFTFISARVFHIVPLVAIVFVALAVILHVVLRCTRFGYRVQAVGSNPEAAHLAGIPLWLVRTQALVLMGAISGLSGALYVGFRGAIDPNEGSDFALIVIAAVIIGGNAAVWWLGHGNWCCSWNADHPGHQQWYYLLWDRCHLEHVRNRCCNHHRGGAGSTREASAPASRSSAGSCRTRMNADLCSVGCRI